MSYPFKPLCAAALLILCTTQAQAVGRLADLTVVDRSNGVNLPVYFHAGQHWVVGTPGAKYAISLCSKVGERLLAVTSVDGLNVLSGASAAWGQTGYVFGSRSCYEITGWRKSDSEVAAFEFSASGDSYAALTGRPKNLGVIGVALFRERRPEPAIAPSVQPRRSQADSAPSPSAAAPMSIQKLGTAHGQREESLVSHTEFERAQTRPNEVIQIRYESREALVALGVIPNGVHRVPNPFPMSGHDSYVPDPPAR